MTQELLAKSTGETLFEHTWAVVEAIRQVVDNLPDDIYDRDMLRKELELAALFHDVGKAAIGFQQVLQRERRDWGGKRHEVISTAFVAHCSELSEEAQMAVLTHHRTLPVDGTAGNEKAAIPSEQMPDQETAVWTDMAREFELNRVLFAEFWERVCMKIERPDLISLAPNALMSFNFSPSWAKQSPTSKFGQLRTIPYERRRRAALYRGLLVTADHMASGHTLPNPIPPILLQNIALIYSPPTTRHAMLSQFRFCLKLPFICDEPIFTLSHHIITKTSKLARCAFRMIPHGHWHSFCHENLAHLFHCLFSLITHSRIQLYFLRAP